MAAMKLRLLIVLVLCVAALATPPTRNYRKYYHKEKLRHSSHPSPPAPPSPYSSPSPPSPYSSPSPPSPPSPSSSPSPPSPSSSPSPPSPPSPSSSPSPPSPPSPYSSPSPPSPPSPSSSPSPPSPPSPSSSPSPPSPPSPYSSPSPPSPPSPSSSPSPPSPPYASSSPLPPSPPSPPSESPEDFPPGTHVKYGPGSPHPPTIPGEKPGEHHIGEKYEPGPPPPGRRPGGQPPNKYIEEKYEPGPPPPPPPPPSPPSRRPGDRTPVKYKPHPPPPPGKKGPEEHGPDTPHVGGKYKPSPPGKYGKGIHGYGGKAPQYKDCPELRDPHYGSVKVSGYSLHQKAIYSCDHGYKLVGSPYRACAYGKWGGDEPECKPKFKCPQLKDPHYGTVNMTGYYPHKKAIYSCYYGYKLVGSPYRKCAYGKWGGDEPVCKPKFKCPQLKDPHYGTVNMTGYYPHKKAIYSCHYGYKLVGSPYRKCAYGKWGGDEPVCKPKFKCPQLKDPHYGTVNMTGYYPHKKAIYSCYYGYKLVGSPYRKCAYGKWGGDEPVCKPKFKCPQLKYPHYGTVNMTGYYPHKKAIYSCHYGYKLVGSPYRKCAYGKWGGDEPVCKPKFRCPQLKDPHYGTVNMTGYYPHKKAIYSCYYGYKLVGSPYRKCAYGKWGGDEPVCKPILCSKPHGIPYGGYKGSNISIGGTVTYYCEQYYKLIGSDKRKCLPNGKWGGTQPKCIPDLCPKLPPPENGYIRHNYEKKEIVYSCKQGYILVGPCVRKCSPHGKWVGGIPKCKPIDCGPLSAIANGAVSVSPDTKLGSSATYTCDKGYTLNGYPTRECLANGEWSSRKPSCRPIDCGGLSFPVNGEARISPNSKLGGLAIYKCRFGYELIGTDTRICQSDGRWSSRSPACRKISCDSPPDPNPNGSIRVMSTRLFGRASYMCNTGYYLRGSRSIYCRADKNWSDKAPLCNAVDCGLPDPPDPNGSKTVTNTTFNGRVKYACNKGFNLVGRQEAICQANGRWSSDAPACKPIDCGKLKNPSGGKVSYYPDTTVHSVATYVCHAGSLLVGSSTRKCQPNGEWAGEEPTCKKTPCPKLQSPHHGKIYVSGYYPGDYMTTSCSHGYRIVGKPRLECLYNGYWSDPPPRCIKEPSHPDKIQYEHPSLKKYE